MDKTIAIVTGASGGLGREFVKLLSKEKKLSEIWVVARNAQKLQQLAEEFGTKIRPIAKDLSDNVQRKELSAMIAEERAAIQYLINNAGYSKFCSYDDLSVEESINMINLNISAVVALGLYCIPYMKPGSHIINIASQASFQPLPYQNIYSSTKAFVRNYTRALNVELKDRRITATAVCPGWIDTGLYERGLIGAKKAASNFAGMVQPDVVAARAMRDARRGKDISVYGAHVKGAHFASKLLPQKVMMKLWLKQQHLK